VRSAWRGKGVANLTLPGLAALVPGHHQVSIQDEQVAPLDLDAPMDLALLTSKTCYAPRAYEIAGVLRARGVPVVMGGCHVSMNPGEAAEHADAVVIGEAEPIMETLLDHAEAGRLEPRYEGGQADMSGVPVPRRDLLQKRYLVDAVMASRGCRYNCRFCCIRGFYGTGLRTRPVGQVLDEVRTLGPRLGFVDENLVGDRDFGRALFAGMVPLGRRFLGQVSADIVEEPDLIDLAARAGCQGFHVGFESVNPASLKGEGKVHNRVEAYEELVERCHRAGILVAAGMIFGLDHDTPEVFDLTIRTLRRLKVDIGYFRMAIPYPGTSVFRRLEREDRIVTRDWTWYDGYYPLFRPLNMTPRQLFEGTRRVQDAFYSKRAIARRVPTLGKLSLPVWAGLVLNHQAIGAFSPARARYERFFERVGVG